MNTIKRTFLTMALCLLFAASVWATPITIAPTTIAPSTTYTGSTCTLRIWSNATFTASDGSVVMAGTPGSGTFFKSVPCTIASGVITIPQFTLQSTTDAIDVQTARYTAIFYDSRGVKRDTYLADFALPLSMGTNQTWAQIRVFKSGKQPVTDNTTYTRFQTDAQIQLAVGSLGTANVDTLGRIETATVPADPVHPKAVLTEDPRIPTQAENDALAGTTGVPSAINKYVTNDDTRLSGGEGGGGTITSFSAGTLAPLFTTSVATPNTTPVLSFTLSDTTQHRFLGRIASGTGAPSYVQPAVASLSDASNIALLNATSNQFSGYMGLYGTVPVDNSAINIVRTGVPANISTKGHALTASFTGSDDLINFGGIVPISLTSTWTGTGDVNHQTMYGIRNVQNHNGTGRIDLALGTYTTINNNGGGILQQGFLSYGELIAFNGIFGEASGYYAQITTVGTTGEIQDVSFFKGRYTHSGAANTAPVVNLRGLNISNWLNGATPTPVTNSYGIYMDATIDVGATRWAIWSGSTSPSLLSGDLTATGLLKAGTTPTTLTDAAGKILSAALNTVQPAQGGTGTSTVFSTGSVVFAGPSGTYTQDNAAFFFDNTNNRLGLNTVNPRTTLDLLNNSAAQLRLTFTDNVVFTDFTTGAGGTLTIAPTGNINFSTVGKQIDPAVGFSENLGSLSKKYLTGHFAEIWAETLVAQNTLATIGGRILVGPTTPLIADLTTGATTINVKYNNLASGDRVYMEAASNVEFMAVTSGPTTITGGFSYTVTRNLDASGANAWFAGDAVFNTGQTGSGFIDLYSVRGVAAASEVGPTIVGNIRNSATFNDWSEHWAIGNLNGLYGYGSNTPGIGLGEFEAGKTHLTVDSTNGIRIFSGLNTVIGQWDAAGVITVGQVAASQSNIIITSAALALRSNTTERIRLNVAGDGFLANSLIAWDTSGNLTVSGNAKIGGFDIGTDYMRDVANSFGLASTVTGGDDVRFWAGDTFANRATSAEFRVTEAGALFASNATITGAVTATSGSFTGSITSTTGTIGGFSLTANTLTAGSGASMVTVSSAGGATPAFSAGSATPTSAPFRVLPSGALTASNAIITGNITAQSGAIGGFDIGTDYIRDVAGTTGIASTVTGGDDVRFWSGNTFLNRSTAPFRVTEAGALVATSATITGSITATSGAINGPLTMSGASSSIAIGSTPPTSASAGTGIWLDRTGLYGLASNVLQAKFDAVTGKITAGAGNVVLDATGIRVVNASDGASRHLYYKDAAFAEQFINLMGVSASSAGSQWSVNVDGLASNSNKNALVSLAAQESGDTQGIKFMLETDLSNTKSFATLHSNVGTFGGFLVSTQGYTTPANSAVLELLSNTKAFLPSRMTTTQRDAIVTPVNGMIFYNSTTDKLQVRAAGAWVDLH